MRLFVAIEIPHEIREVFADFLKELRAVAPQVKWVRAENLHVTLKFLGETEAGKLDAIHNSLAPLRAELPVTLGFRGLGFFPNEKRPKVFWAGMEASPNLKALAGELDHALHQLGFPQEVRPFTPHLTLARFKAPGLPANLLALARKDESRAFGSMTASEFHLIESKLKPSGAEYTTLQSFPFVTEA